MSDHDDADELRPRFPGVTVKLSGEDGNAFAILGRVRGALRAAGATPDELATFTDQATGGTYDELLQTCMRWVAVE